jgi:hypothetical protein
MPDHRVFCAGDPGDANPEWTAPDGTGGRGPSIQAGTSTLGVIGGTGFTVLLPPGSDSSGIGINDQEYYWEVVEQSSS